MAFLAQNSLNITEFDELVSKFLNFLKVINGELPGPQPVAIKFYKMRKNNKTIMTVKW